MAAGDLLSLTVRDATPIDPDAGGIHAENAMLAQGRLAIVLFGAATGGVDAQGKWKPVAVASRIAAAG